MHRLKLCLTCKFSIWQYITLSFHFYKIIVMRNDLFHCTEHIPVQTKLTNSARTISCWMKWPMSLNKPILKWPEWICRWIKRSRMIWHWINKRGVLDNWAVKFNITLPKGWGAGRSPLCYWFAPVRLGVLLCSKPPMSAFTATVISLVGPNQVYSIHFSSPCTSVED